MAPPIAQRLTQNQLIDKLAKDRVRMDNRQRATLRLGQFQDLVMARAESWQIAARNVGSAYATAAKRHTDALAKQEKIDALKDQAIFSVLTVATSGALSWVSSGLALTEKFKERELLVRAIETAEDTAQATAGEVFSAMGPPAQPLLFSQRNQAANIDPQVFQNERENAVSEAKIKVLERFARIKSAWAADPLEDWDTYDEAKQRADHDAWLKEADTLAGKDALPKIEVMADELERGIWAAWMPGLKGHSWTMPRGPRPMERVDDYTSVGSAVEERLDKLGVLKMANVEIHFWQAAEYEDMKLIAWAQGYKVKSLVSLKQ